MAKDITTEETVDTDKVAIAKTRIRQWWDTNKNKLFWFGVGTLTGAGTVIGTALLLDPTDEQYEGDNEETVAIDVSEETPS